MLKVVSNCLWKQAKGLDPPDSIIGIGSDLKNWMPDTVASSRFTTCLLDLKEVEEGFDFTANGWTGGETSHLEAQEWNAKTIDL